MENFIMNPQIEKLSRMLNLSPYQSQTLVGGSDKYNMSRLVKRGGLLYAPYNMRGVFGRASDILRGRRADLIGYNKTLLRGQRGIKFYAAGYHCVRIGRFMYYADSTGAAISRRAFLRGINTCDGR